jgi:hypothetical protein
MVQPYDYTLKTPSPGEAFFKAVQLGQQQQQVEAQRLQAEAQRAKVQAEIDKAAKKALIFKTKLGPGATYESRNEAIGELPDDVAAIQSYWKDLNEGRQNFFLETARKAYYGLSPDANGVVNVQNAVTAFTERADAAKGSGDTVLEKQLRDLATMVGRPDADPRLAQGIIDLQVRAVNPKAADEMTGFGDAVAAYRAAGGDPFSPKGRELLNRIAYKSGQILLTGVKTPYGDEYTGTLDDYLTRFGPAEGGGQAAPQGKPRVFSNVAAIPADLKVGDIVNGKEYIGGSGDKPFNNPNNWVTPKKGGQTERSVW